MQQTKRRSKKGVILLALTIAMLVLAFVPAALASPPAQSQLTPDVSMGGQRLRSGQHRLVLHLARTPTTTRS